VAQVVALREPETTTAGSPTSATVWHGDGRQVGYAVWGEPGQAAPAIVHCHGAPGSRIPNYPVDMPAGYRHVSLDRPGYGLSEPLPGRRMADHALDVELVLDHLQIGRFSVFGWSGGAAPALGLGARLPERVARIVVGAGRAPVDAPVFEAEIREELLRDWEKNRADCETMARLYRRAPDQFFAWMERGLKPSDLEGFRQLRPAFTRSYDAAFAVGGEGWFEDDMQLVSPWAYDLDDVRCEVQLWHAEADAVVPVAHGRYLAEHLPRCEAHIVGGEGESHGSLVRLLPEMCAWAAEPLLSGTAGGGTRP
jgi:pimeloyl-ACP methyl ester carboxylesterase